ncbi:hypothetical protein SK803_25330 [Lentzea sp. BCCO 10_0856]|uniref:Uncharacterized protein n=1 Tax=Lentzea miocenica TaxID=3095431 RepID=A0ABU4T5W0_9PSEU|nr:hypothetical protein [Lentzea sp. BCCO 10_0856]MDX8033556.1 hypothetical protein [Lentzea sp. BCCO 10_0856]
MGFFGTYAFENDQWITLPEAERPPLVEPFLWINILNSDLTEVVYAPPGPGTGVAYLGQTPWLVEIKTAQFLMALGLPLPAELSR